MLVDFGGGREAAALCQRLGIRLAVTQDKSPSCGAGAIYDGSFSGRRIPGSGITAERLTAMGVVVYTEADAEALIQKELIE